MLRTALIRSSSHSTDARILEHDAPINSSRTAKGQLIVALKCADLRDRSPRVALRTYIWNPSKRMAHIASVRLQVRQGDPVLYGSFQPLPGPWEYR